MQAVCILPIVDLLYCCQYLFFKYFFNLKTKVFFVSYKLFPSLLKLYSIQHSKTMKNDAPESVSRLWHRARQLASQQLTRLGEDLVDNPHDEREKEWQKVLISTCFTSGIEIALHFHQITDSKLDSLHFVCILVAIIFSCLFVSHFINPAKFPMTSKVLGKVAVFLAATVFFITISIPFPPRVKWTTWIIYAISLLVIAICNLFY